MGEVATVEEVEGGSARKFERGRKGSNRKQEPMPTKLGGDEASKGEKTKDNL